MSSRTVKTIKERNPISKNQESEREREKDQEFTKISGRGAEALACDSGQAEGSQGDRFLRRVSDTKPRSCRPSYDNKPRETWRGQAKRWAAETDRGSRHGVLPLKSNW